MKTCPDALKLLEEVIEKLKAESQRIQTQHIEYWNGYKICYWTEERSVK